MTGPNPQEGGKRLVPEADVEAMAVIGQPVEQLGEVGGVLNVETDLGDAVPDGGRAAEQIDDVPAVNRVGLDVEPLAHPQNLAQMESADMATRYTYQTGVSFGGDIPTAEFDVELAYRINWASNAVEDLKVLKVNGKLRPWNRGSYTPDDELADAVLEQLEGIEPELIAHAADQEADASLRTFPAFLRGAA